MAITKYPKSKLGRGPPSTRMRWAHAQHPQAGYLTLLFTLALVISPAKAVDFTELSMDELMRVEISSVSRKLESLFDAPAAVHLITNEDIKRSGVIKLTEALRMSPGIHVGRIDDNSIAVASRGFNDVSSNKLLVMTDGRSVYSPLFSGVQWSDQQVIMEDLDRIEVIRGPGAALWGANAVNGVINIKTKSARDTVGSFASVLYGDYTDLQIVARQGMDLGDNHFLRVFAKYIKEAPANRTTPLPWTEPDTDRYLVGFRYDRESDDRGTLTIQGDYSEAKGGSLNQTFLLTPPYFSIAPGTQESEDAYLLVRWTQTAWDDGEFSIQGYVDDYSQLNPLFGEDRLVADVDAQIRKAISENNEIVAGVGFRHLEDELTDKWYTFEPLSDSRALISAFLQDEYRTNSDKLRVTIGAKFEHNDYTGWELQPNVRTLYQLNDDQVLWASLAKAARTPSRAERSARIIQGIVPPNPLSPVPTKIALQASPDFDSEQLTAFEMGHRFSSGESFSFDTALFYNRYTDIRSFEPSGMETHLDPVPHVDFISHARNGVQGSTYGAEFTANMQPAPNVRLQGTASFLAYNLENAHGSLDTVSIPAIEGTSPKTQLSLRAMIDVSEDWMLDIVTHYASSLKSPGIDYYTALDLRLAWTPSPGIELSVVGRDLLESDHVEFAPSFLGGDVVRIPRSYYARINWKF